MDFRELVKNRYSVRAYKSNPVEGDKLRKILEAAILAPTAANRQPFRLLVIKTEGRQKDLKRIYGRDWFVQAPLVVCACAVKGESWVRKDGKNYGEVDATIAFTHLLLAARDLGLGTCWIAAFDPEAARDVLNLPSELEPVAFTPLGYPADKWNPKKRRPVSELVQFIT
ncbi:MAG: nitroreductase family protein [Candidatus Aminicenantales bacterium]